MKKIAVILGSDAQGSLPLSDRAAMAMAVRGLAGEVDAYTARSDEPALRYALAAGARTATVTEDPAGAPFDVALVGAGGCGLWGDLLPAMLAQRRGAAMVLDVLGVEATDAGLRVTRDLGRGACEVLRVRGPAVLVISGSAPQTMYVSRHRRQAATPARAPAARAATDPLAKLAGDWEPTRPRVKTENLAAKTGGAARDRMNALMGAAGAVEDASDRQVIIADAATCASHLLRYLRHHGFIAGSMPSLPSAPGFAGGTRTFAAPKLPVSPKSPTARNPPAKPGAGGRAPRPLTGSPRGLDRRPRSLTVQPVPQGKLARSPRPVGDAPPRRVRGPFPWQGPPHHG